MVCPKCKCENVNTQIITESQIVSKHHGIIWWLLIGWWWVPIKWIFFTLPALLFAIFGGKKKIVTKQKTMCICQGCGHSWNV